MTSTTTATSARPALTEANIKSAQPGALLRDAYIPGLHLRVFAGRKSFYLWFRTKHGQERRPKLGDHGVITLTQARTLAKEMLLDVAAGADPIADRTTARNEPTMGDLWVEYWKRHGRKKKSGDEDLKKWNHRIEAKFGSRKLSAITYSDMADFHEEISAEAPTQANRTLALLSKMFNFAHRPLQWFDGANPCKGVARNKEVKRRRKASRDEIARIVSRLHRELGTDNQASAAFLLLLLLTGARTGEIAAARWENVHGNRILLDEHKTDDGGYARIIYLSQPALDVIARLPVTRGTITGIQDPKHFWERIRVEEGMPDLRKHDLRRTFASVALSSGRLSLEQVMQMLGHASAQTTKVYAWLMEDSAADAVRLVAEQMKALPSA